MSERTTIQHYAFPTATPDLMYLQTGMTLRGWFAGRALAGHLATFGPDDVVAGNGLAHLSYKIADAMMEARK